MLIFQIVHVFVFWSILTITMIKRQWIGLNEHSIGHITINQIIVHI